MCCGAKALPQPWVRQTFASVVVREGPHATPQRVIPKYLTIQYHTPTKHIIH